MLWKNKFFQLCIAFGLGVLVLLIPRPEGTKFKITGDVNRQLFNEVREHFDLVSSSQEKPGEYILVLKTPLQGISPTQFLRDKAEKAGLKEFSLDYVDGLSPTGKRFLAVTAVLVFLFMVEPVPLEITAVCIGVFLVLMGIADVKDAWAAYMNPVVVFIMCCLIFAIALDKAGITKRLGYFVVKKAGTSITKFTFILAGGLGIASAFIHDAAACAIGIVTAIPLMRAAGVHPYSNTGKFVMLSIPFAASCGGMGSLVGGGRCMVAAAFLKEFTGIELSFLDWMIFAMPAAIITTPAAIAVVYLIFRPDPTIKLPQFDEDLGPLTPLEKKTLAIVALTFLLWLTKEYHGFHYSVTGMLGVAALVICNVLKWDDIHANLEWGTALFIFGGGISLGLAMDYSGAAAYFAHLFFPLVKGGGWLLLFIGVGVFGAIVTNAMANVAAAALILPIVIPLAQLEGVDPRVMALCLGMATSFAMLLVIGCPPNAIAYSFRYFKASDLTKAGLVATPVLLAILVLVAGLWWKILGLV